MEYLFEMPCAWHNSCDHKFGFALLEGQTVLVRILESFAGEMWNWYPYMEGKERRKRQTTPDWYVAVLISEGTSM